MPTALSPDHTPRRPGYWLLLLALLPATLGATEPAADKGDVDEIIADTKTEKADPAAEKFWRAVRLLQGKKPGDVPAGRAALQENADQEYTHAQVLLGNCLLSGSYGFTKDERKAANLFRLAAERGNAFAKVSLGSCYVYGTGVRKDDEKAATWLTSALATGADYSQPAAPKPDTSAATAADTGGVAGELGHDPVGSSQANAHYLLGLVLSRQKKPAEAQAHYVSAATAGPDGRSGIYAAAVQAALNYAFGQGVSRDPAKAAELLDVSRKLNARQQVSLIHNYVSLKLVDEFAVADLEESVDQAGASNQASLQLNIAASLGNKKSKDYNLTEAVRWYELAADNGQVWAMLQLGLIYARGELGQPDPAKAFGWFEKAGGGDKPKHYLGIANLAICYQNGFGTPRDPEKAKALFTKYQAGDIVCYLGSIGQCPATPLTAEEVVSLNETWAKQKNDRHGQFLLSTRYLNGWGVKADQDTAMKWLQKAGKAGHGAALCQLGYFAENTREYVYGRLVVTEESLKKALNYYRLGTEAGNSDAIANYANMLANGQGTPQDLAKAEALYRKCLQVEPDHARAHTNLANLFENKLSAIIDTMDGDRIKNYRSEMLEHYEAGIRLHYAYAARNLGTIYYQGRLVKQDWNKAYAYFEQATQWGLPIIHYSLGYMHELGQGVPVTLTEAAYHYRLAALEGNLDALRRLSNFYLTGRGVSLDLDRAIFWLQQMVRQGFPQVLPTICDILLKKEEYAKVIPILRDMSKMTQDKFAGYAYDRLALCYKEGRGVKADQAKSDKYFKEALRRGNADALTDIGEQEIRAGKIDAGVATLTRAAPNSRLASYNLGNMYYFGVNVAHDRERGLKYIRAAAEMNHPDALYFLAAMTFNKEPDAPSMEEAIQLAQQAETGGHPKGADLREKLEKRRKLKQSAPEEATRARST